MQKNTVMWSFVAAVVFILATAFSLLFYGKGDIFPMNFLSMNTMMSADDAASGIAYNMGSSGGATKDMMYAEEASIGRMAAPLIAPAPSQGIMPIYDQYAPTETTDRLIIKNGNMGIQVNDVAATLSTLGTKIEALGGFVISSNVYNIERAPQGYLQVRVPVEKFEEARSVVRSSGKLTSDSVSGQDVTEEFVDIEARLKNLKATEEQFLNILNEAQDVEDILAVQRELSNVRAQIESYEGRKDYLSKSAQFSTLSIELTTNPEEVPIVDEKKPWQPLAVLKDASRGLVELGQGMVNFLIWIIVFLPVWLVVGLIIWGIKVRMSHGQTNSKK